MKPRFILCAALLAAALTAGCTQNNSSAPEPSAEATAAVTVTEEPTMNKKGQFTEKELCCDHDGGQIYGVAYIADETAKTPLVILSHGLGANHDSLSGYARRIAQHGCSAYVFDFPNGSVPGLENRSGTQTDKMSVMTEAAALNAVLDAAKGWDFADSSAIYLLGESQGGLVSAVVACERQNEVAGMLLLYPAFNIPHDVRANYQSLDEVPDEYDLLGLLTVGKIYAEDVWDLDIYEKLAACRCRTMILHGDRDSIVDVSYSEQADEVMSDCELTIFEGADHGFHGEDWEDAADLIIEFLGV